MHLPPELAVTLKAGGEAGLGKAVRWATHGLALLLLFHLLQQIALERKGRRSNQHHDKSQ